VKKKKTLMGRKEQVLVKELQRGDKRKKTKRDMGAVFMPCLSHNLNYVI
jgi:hypothetical protein